MPKPLIVALAAVAVVVLVLLGAGVTREAGSADPGDHGWVDRFEFGGAPRVGADDLVSSDCFDPLSERFVVSANATCATVVAAADGPIRVLGLAHSGSPPPVAVEFDPADDEGVEIEDWDPDDDDFPLQVPVGPGGGTMRLSCGLLTGSCALRLEQP